MPLLNITMSMLKAAGSGHYNDLMLKLYREDKSPAADIVEAELKDILLGYERVIMGADAAREKFGAQHSLPILTDNERLVSGQEALVAYLQELRSFMHDWQAFQGDSCYVDEDGRNC
jgi:hypothetical protein